MFSIGQDGSTTEWYYDPRDVNGSLYEAYRYERSTGILLEHIVSVGAAAVSQSTSRASTSSVILNYSSVVERFIESLHKIIQSNRIANSSGASRQSRALLPAVLRSLVGALKEVIKAMTALPPANQRTRASSDSRFGSVQPTINYKSMSSDADQSIVGSLRSFLVMLLVPSMNGALSGTRLLELMIPALEASQIFERFRAGLSPKDWIKMESAHSTIRPTARAEESHDTPARKVVHAFKKLMTDLTALRTGSAAGLDKIALTTSDPAQEDSSLEEDYAASEVTDPGAVTGNLLKLKLKEQGTLKFLHVNAKILIGDALKVVKAVVEFGIHETYRFGGARMSVVGIFS